MTRAVLALALCGVAQAHVVSLSSGELRVTGPRSAVYELEMPLYEVEHVADPETALLDQLRFGDARRVSSSCQERGDVYACRAEYEFATDFGDALEIECTLFRATVPNHVHMLYAVKGAEGDQQIFDQSYPVRELRFHPPSAPDRLRRDAVAGARRLLASVAGLLFLGVLALAARSRQEALVLAALFVVAEVLARVVAALLPIGLSPAFLEAAMALTVAYLAAEILFLPEGRARWAIVPVLGVVHGLPFAAFPMAYVTGAVLIQAVLLAAAFAAAWKMPTEWRKPASAALLVAGVAWFGRLLLLGS